MSRPARPFPRASLWLLFVCACGSSAEPDNRNNNMGPVGTGGTMAAGNADAGMLPADAPGFEAPITGDPCAQTVCNSPPANTCVDNTLTTYYDPNGTCSVGVCSYRFTMTACPRGCLGDRCFEGSPTDGPPGDAPVNSCVNGQCTTPPANFCDGSTLKTYFDPKGTCNAGICSYQFTTQTCPNGCMNGACVVSTCTPGSAVFTADVTDVDSLAVVGTLPALAGGAAYEIRSYMQVKDSYAGMMVPIYAPTDMTLIASANYLDPLHDPSDTGYTGEWGLTFQASCTTTVDLAHVRQVVKKISDASVPNPGGGSAGSLVKYPVKFAPGEVIGHYVRGPGFFAWDFVVTDTSVTNAFVNMPRYQDGSLKFLHAICPYDLYQQPKRQRYLDLLGTNNDPPMPGRKCGTIAHDKAGTAAGAWFHFPYVSGTPDEARRASRNPMSMFKAETGVVYVANLDGDADNAGFATFRIEPTNPTFRDPKTITTSHCYERQLSPNGPASGWAFIQVVSNTSMKIAYSAQGSCPTTFPTTGVRTYYR